jgi:heterotetrameric sarcosine oxidase gamma subunit
MSTSTQMLVALGRDHVSVSELSGSAHILITSAIGTDETVSTLFESCGIDIPSDPGTICETASCIAFWLSPRSWLLRLPVNDEAVVLDKIGRGFPDRRVHATPYSDALQWIGITGQDGEALLARGGFVSLSTDGFPSGHFKRTLIADIPLLIWRRDAEQWEVGCERSRTRYFVHWIENTLAISDLLRET